MVTDLATRAWDALVALPTWQGFLLVVGASVVLAKLIQVGGDVVIRRVTRKIPGDVDAAIFRSLHPPLYVTVVLVGAFAAVLLLDIATDWTDVLEAGLFTILTVLWVYSLTRMGRRVSNEATRDDRFNNQVVPIFQNVWTAVLLGGGLYLVLTIWNINVTPLLASAGVLGIVLGLAARDTIANFFGSIALYADRTYAVGDFVVLESGESGRVEDISIRSTDIRTRDDTLVTVPNSALNTATIVNESSPQRETRLNVSISVAYGSDLDHVEDVLIGVAEAERLVNDEPRPRVRFREFGEDGIALHLKCWIGGPTQRGRVRHRLIKGIHARFREEGIEIPFPQRVVTMAEDATDDGWRDRTDGERADQTDAKWADETAPPAGTPDGDGQGSPTDQADHAVD